MVPFSTFATRKWTYGSPKLERYNGCPSTETLGEPAPGAAIAKQVKIAAYI